MKNNMIISALLILVLMSGCASSGTAGMRIQAKRARVPYQGIRTIECDDCDIHLYHARSNCVDYKRELKNLDTLQAEITDVEILEDGKSIYPRDEE